jgi:hypothetical protein
MCRFDVGHVKVNGRAPLRLLAGRRNTDEHTNGAAHEKGHLRWRCEQERQTQDIAIKGYAMIEIVDWNQQLSDGRVREIQSDDPEVAPTPMIERIDAPTRRAIAKA